MSEAVDRALVQVESSSFERVGASLIALSFLTILLTWGTLFGWFSLSSRVAGISLFQSFGLLPLVLGLTLLGLGVASSRGLAATTPDRSVGLVTAVLFGLVWWVVGGAVAASTLGLGSLGWLVVGPILGLGVTVGSLLVPEDLGATLPVGVPLVAFGAAVVGPVIDPGWIWNPATLSAAFPASVAVPLLSMACALLGGWTAGKAYNGFGTRGRQTGAYLLISLVVFVVLAVLVLLVVFIATKGAGTLFRNLTVGAGTGLVVLLLPLGIVGIRLSRGLNTTTRVRAARSALGVGFAAVGSALVALFAVLLVSDTSLTWGSITLASTPRVGIGIALVVSIGLLAALRVAYDGIHVRTVRSALPERFRAGLIALLGVLTMLAVVAVSTSALDPTFSLAVAPVVAGLAVGVAWIPAIVTVQRARAGQPVWSAAGAPVQELQVGVGGGLALLLLAVVFEVSGGLVPVASPTIPVVGGLAAVAVAAQLVGLAFLVTAVAVIASRRRDGGESDTGAGTGPATTEPAEAADALSGSYDIGRDLVLLALTGVAGAATLLVAHALVTFNELDFLGLLTVTPYGVLDWPFVMNPSQGLGIQTGVMPAIVGTVWLVVGAVLLAVPLAVGAAVYLTEYAEESLLTRGVEVATNGLWSTPSIVFGLFGLAFIVPRFGNSPSLFAGQLVLGFMLLPLVLITSRESMKAVPDEYRDASAALGVSQWQTIRSVVIPAALPGVITGIILGIGRIAGETAPILLVMRGPIFPGQAPDVLGSFSVSVGAQPPFLHVTNPALLDQASALPYQLFAIISAGVGENAAFGWGTALVLLSVVLTFYAIGIASRRYFRSKLQS